MIERPEPSDDCPEPPPLRAPQATQLLHEACEIAGGISKLALLLGMSATALGAWLVGSEEPPSSVCMACAQIILQS